MWHITTQSVMHKVAELPVMTPSIKQSEQLAQILG